MASAASQSAELFSCHMILKVNPVTPLASPLGEEDHEVAKGWTVVRMIMILNVDVTAEGGIIKLIAPSRGNERYEGKKASHILHVPFRRFPSLVAVATTLPCGRHVI